MQLTNQQAEEISRKIYDTPSDIQKSEESKQILIADKESKKLEDDVNRQFFLKYLSNVQQYHFELQNIIGETRTIYNENDLISSAKKENGNPHFPLGYTSMVPMVLSSNNGNPKGLLPYSEITFANYFIRRVNLFKNGYPGSGFTTSTTTVLNGNSVQVASTGPLSIGDAIAIHTSSDLFGGTISNINGDTLTFNISIGANNPIPIGANVQRNYPSYTNTQRQNLVNDIHFDAIRFSLDTNSTLLANMISNQLEAIKANQSGDDAKNAYTSANKILSAIKSWQNSPSSGVGGRYTDEVIDPLVDALNNRIFEANKRSVEIGLNLGSVQNQGDIISGSGQYQSLFKWIDFRINLLNGSLSQYYGADFAINAVSQNIAFLNSQYTEYLKQFGFAKFVKDSDATNKVFLDSVSDLLVGAPVYVMADGQSTINTQVMGISVVEKSVTFDKIISIGFNVKSKARVFRVK